MQNLKEEKNSSQKSGKFDFGFYVILTGIWILNF